MTEPTTATKDTRIPATLSRNSILADFCRQYLGVVDEIASYNAEVLAEKSSEWNTTKVLEKAKELGRPTDANVPAKDEIKNALDEWERLVSEVNRARRNVLDVTAKELGITLSATAERNPETEAPLKDKRKLANEIGTQLGMIAKMTTDEKASAAVSEFLEGNPLPAVGRDQSRTFGSDEKATPKYRVTVRVSDKDGNVKLEADGFTKAALGLTKFYERGQAPKSDTLREVWEKNGAPETSGAVVEFDDNELHFVITKK